MKGAIFELFLGQQNVPVAIGPCGDIQRHGTRQLPPEHVDASDQCLESR